MAQHRVKLRRGLGPVLGQGDVLAHRRGQPLLQGAGLRRPHGLAAHGQHGGQLRQQISVLGGAFGQTQHRLTRPHRVQIGFAGGPGQAHPGADRRLGGGLVALRRQQAQATLPRPVTQRGQRQCRTRVGVGLHQAAQRHTRCHAVAGDGQAGRLHRALGQQPHQVQRPTGLGPRARQAFAAKGLDADHRAHDVAIDIDVAGPRRVHHLGHRLVDPGVDPQRQAVAGGVDVGQHLRQLLTPVAQHMQHRPEHLAIELGHCGNFNQRGRHKTALCGQRRAQFSAPDLAALPLHGVHMTLDGGQCFGVDHRAHIGGQSAGVADAQLRHCALQHGDQAVGHIVLHTQQPQRRTPLAGAVKGRGHDVGHRLLGQRG